MSRCDCLSFGEGLKITPQKNNEEEIDHSIVVNLTGDGAAECDIERVEISDAGADRNRQIHTQVQIAQSVPGTPVERVTGIEQCRRRERETDPMKQCAKLTLISTRVEGDGDPQQIHHGETRKRHAIEQASVLPVYPAFGSIRIVGHGYIADLTQPANDGGELLATVVPLDMQLTPGKVDPGLSNARHRVQTVFDQPDAGSTVDSFNQQVNIPEFAQVPDELLLHLIQIVKTQFARQFRRRPQQSAFGSPLVKPLKTCIVDRLTNRATTVTAERSRLTVEFRVDSIGLSNRKRTVKTALLRVSGL